MSHLDLFAQQLHPERTGGGPGEMRWDRNDRERMDGETEEKEEG